MSGPSFSNVQVNDHVRLVHRTGQYLPVSGRVCRMLAMRRVLVVVRDDDGRACHANVSDWQVDTHKPYGK